MDIRGNNRLRAAVAVGVLSLFTQAYAADDPQQGLVLTVTSGGATDVSIAPNVWLYAPQGQPATPFVPAGPFTARWQGWVSADLRSDYTLQAAFSGEVKVSVNGALALEAKGVERAPIAGKSVRLNKGTNALLVEYVSPATGDAFIRLYWTNRETPLNPIPLTQLTHTASDALIRSLEVRAGRDLVAELRCTKCHAFTGAMPELLMDAPSFDDIGARRQADWMAQWILDPSALRPGTPMPKVFTGPDANAEAVAVAAYLATLKGETKLPATGGDAMAGKALFEKLHCEACHVPPEGGESKPHQISQKLVKAKFTSGALAAFLLKPEEHFAWIRMPNFQLKPEEASNLAAYLESVADLFEPKAPKSDTALIERGQRLVATSGCLNCHTLTGVKSELTAKPLSELASWSSGCLADSLAPGSKYPHYALDVTARAALRAFGSTDRLSLSRSTAADFLSRQSQHLNCRQCHGQFEGFPAWELLYGKLKPDWASRFIAGQESVKPRNWSEARMPAFPAYAKGLGEGLSTFAGLPPHVEEDPKPANAAELTEAGRKLASANGGFSCISCHGAAEFGATQVFEAPGINLAQSYARLQPEYYQRWLRAPTMIDGTSKMPVYFDEEGKSPLTEVLGGDGPKTIQAIWEYLRLGDKMPRPD